MTNREDIIRDCHLILGEPPIARAYLNWPGSKPNVTFTNTTSVRPYPQPVGASHLHVRLFVHGALAGNLCFRAGSEADWFLGVCEDARIEIVTE